MRLGTMPYTQTVIAGFIPAIQKWITATGAVMTKEKGDGRCVSE